MFVLLGLVLRFPELVVHLAEDVLLLRGHYRDVSRGGVYLSQLLQVVVLVLDQQGVGSYLVLLPVYQGKVVRRVKYALQLLDPLLQLLHLELLDGYLTRLLAGAIW